jgi:peptidoglycan hydrolase CwlO-like protein
MYFRKYRLGIMAVTFGALLVFSTCDQNPPERIELATIEKPATEMRDFEKKVLSLRRKIESINEKEVLIDLDVQERDKFESRIEELKKNFNDTASLIRERYDLRQKMDVERSYLRTKTIWEYMIRSYPI